MTVAELTARPLPAGAGRKAEHLAWLAREGFRVPPGWVIPSGADGIVLRTELERLLDPDAPYAVRSSADVEDGSARSFAGQFRTYLDVIGVEAVARAVEAVQSSVRDPSVAAYTDVAGVEPGSIGMGVIVQRMVTPSVSGVAFSKNPLTGLDEVVIEAVPGRGDALVQDGVTPDRWIHRWGELTERPVEPRTDHGLIEEVAREARRIAEAFGQPADLEWVHDGTSLYWVQVRPIAGLEGIGIYSNRIAREVLPGIIKPLVWSVNVPVVNQAWVDLFTEAIGPNDIDPNRLARAFGFRAYFDMGAIGDIFVALGMPRESLELLLGLPAGRERPRFRPTRTTMRHTPRMLRLAWRLNRFDRRLERQLPRLQERYRDLALIDPATLDDEAVLERVDALMALTRRTAYANIVAPLLMNAYGSLVRRRSERLGVDGARVDPARGYPGIHDYDPRHAIAELAEIAAGLPDDHRVALESGGYAALAADPELASLQAGVDAFLSRFGHLSDSGNDFSTPRWREQPDVVVRMILDTHPAASSASMGWEDVAPLAGRLSRPILHRIFRRAAKFRQQREAVSFHYTFGYELFRRTFLTLGDRLVARGALTAPDDVFYLTLDELRSSVRTGEPAPAPIVQIRRAEVRAAASLDLPEIILGDDYVPRIKTVNAAPSLRGVPSSRGTYRGPARIIRSSEEFGRMARGDVLVAPHSDVAWTPLFARAGAVVAESGGMLSHSSIVAREYGIPCVVSVPGCLDIADGTMVHVDGFSGEVTVEGRQPETTTEGGR
ncbi:MAG: PEP-utilizing enzyme [Chloroflexota bacterium]|jgi:phosphohistidine swiveling domain-containing protein|nr:PEP-utilizing enzyme [Chloroflexota bacterium]MDH5242384.1 PEP-utilizing enzyme [Chloroflexota bacterium]